MLLFHNICGWVVNEHSGELQCSFCKGACHSGFAHGFQLHLTIADDSAKVFAWCVGQTAIEFLQISPDEYLELPEVQATKLAPPHHEKKCIALSLPLHRRFDFVGSHNGTASLRSHASFLLIIAQDERAMYLYTLQNESFMVAIANTSKRVDGCGASDEALPVWEITRAQKCE